MTFLKKLLCSLFCFLLLSACQPTQKTYAYLVSHPDELKEQVMRCEANNSDQAYCEMVQRAQRDFDNLYNQWREGPEDFGKTILKLQMTNADLKSLTQNAFSEPLDQQQMIDAYLAVVGVTPVE